jgi:hypothetical protein
LFVRHRRPVRRILPSLDLAACAMRGAQHFRLMSLGPLL